MKRTLLIVAGLILLLTAAALAVNWFLQPILPPPWDNIALIVLVTMGLVVAFLDNLTAVIAFIHNWLYPPPQPPPSGSQVWTNIKRDFVGGDSIGRDKITAEQVIILADRAADDFWRTYRRPPQPNIQAATSRYLQFIINRYQFLDFKGMGVTDRAAFGLPLLQVYVPLKARPEMPAGETWSRATRLAGHLLGEAELMGQMGMRPSHEPHPALDLLRENDGLIILGDPGSGKSTFLKVLALQHAFGKQGETGLGLRLPVLLPLAAYAKALVEEDVPLHKFMAAYYQRLGMDAALGDLLTEALQQGGALLLLDGLDEVREPNLRQTVVERVMSFFAFHQQNGNKFVLTSRIVGYKDVRPSGTRLAECTLEDFDNDEITQFVDQWTAAIEQQATADPTLAAQQAQQEKETLLYSVRHNGGVRKLAANPLLLTILALMKRQGVVLPERRVELYDKYLETLLKSWNLARSLDGRPTTRDLDVAETIRVLAPLALWMHETSPSMGVVRRQALHHQLEQIYTTRQAENPAQAAQKLLEDAREYAGLLVERGADEYGFVHLTFQEYLAAVAMAQQAQGDARPVATQLAQHLHQDTWREVSLLTIGYIAIRQQLDTVASDVLLQLLQPASAPLTINHSQFTIHNSQALILVGESLTDIGSANVTPACRKQIEQALLAGLTAATIPAQERARVGQLLAKLGDPRPNVTDVDHMPFAFVPAGAFVMGDPESEKPPREWIFWSPQHTLTLPYGYWIARFPVTNAHFAPFVAAGGYAEPRYWPEAIAAKLWENGTVNMYTHVGDGNWEQQKRTAPRDYGADFNAPNQPRVGLSWYEALAYARWLTERWHAAGWLPAGWEVTLPSEAEWEKAARGGLEIPTQPHLRSVADGLTPPQLPLQENDNPRRPFPWAGGEYTTEHANTDETGIGRPSAVGAFPLGTSPVGCEEMGGNVFEWTRSIWGKNWDSKKQKYEQEYGYPYQPEDGRENLAADIYYARTVRTGVYGLESAFGRCAARYRGVPRDDGGNYGLRLVVVPIQRSAL